jgi:thiamine transporter ThiT
MTIEGVFVAVVLNYVSYVVFFSTLSIQYNNSIRDKSINDNRGAIICSGIELCHICCLVLCLFNTIHDKSLHDNSTLSIHCNT